MCSKTFSNFETFSVSLQKFFYPTVSLLYIIIQLLNYCTIAKIQPYWVFVEKKTSSCQTKPGLSLTFAQLLN
jgi:hypothetical protein